MIEKRYQVFVSSTYADLQDERQEVMQALLELDCIPAGMELFPAANEDQWTLIKGVIDDCDYYLVIVAGRYGSIGPDGRSYTEMEYRYALEKNKPVMAFLHKSPGRLAQERCETTDEGKRKLEEFRTFLQNKMCRFWESPPDLGSQVSRSLVKLIKNNPTNGWVRGDAVPDVPAAEEILQLKKKIEQLEAALESTRLQAPEGTQNLAQGEDKFEISFYVEASSTGYKGDAERLWFSQPVTWNRIFAEVSPKMINEVSESGLKESLKQYIAVLSAFRVRNDKTISGKKLFDYDISEDHFDTIKVQLRALGLITKSLRPRSVKDTQTYWTLTPYGDAVMTRLRAIQKNISSDET